MLRVSVLGPVRAWLGDDEVDLGQTRQRALFALLATAPGRFVGRAELIAGLWGAAPPATAAGSVHTYVSGLRRALVPYGRELLTSKASAYSLAVDPADVDGERFGVLVARATDARTASDPATVAGLLGEALLLWQGDEAYAGLSGFAVERAHLHDRRLAAVELRARALMELGDGDLVAELAVLVRDNPLHEPLHELLMLALHRAGRHADALEVFHTARRTFAAELGVEPGSTLRALHRTVLGGRFAEPEPPARLAPLPPARSARKAGEVPREELERLRQLLRDLLVGKGGAVWIRGKAAAGKSALLTAAFADADCQVAWTTTGDVGQALGISGTADELVGHVRAVCRNGPLLLVVDGLREDPSRWLGRRLAAASRRLPLLLVVAGRHVEGADGAVLSLPPPGPGTVEELVARLAQLTPGTRDFLRRAAPLGREFDTDTALEATALTPFDLIGVVEEALAADVLTDLGGRFAFTHTVQYDALFPSADGADGPSVRDTTPPHPLTGRVAELRAQDLLDEADRVLREATLEAIGSGRHVDLSTASAIQSFWRGHWDDVPERVCGVAALIAAHRGDVALAGELLAAAEEPGDPELAGFVAAARALVASQDGEFVELSTTDPQWLPDAVRSALAHGRTGLARKIAASCHELAGRESRPARAHIAALRCRALLSGNPEPALAAAAHDEAAGRPVECAAALEDAAVLLAARRRPQEAADAAAQACALWERLGAHWDLRRAHHRLAEYGITP